MKITTVQWNIGGGKVRNPSASPEIDESYAVEGIDTIISSLSKYQPDIVTLEETHADKSTVQAQIIGKKLGLESVNDEYDHSHLEPNQELGQAILSKFPIKNHSFNLFFNPHYEVDRPNGEHWVSHDKGLTVVEAELPGGETLGILTLHMIPFRAFGIDPKSEEAKPVIDSVTNLIRDAVNKVDKFVLQGDFNLNTDTVKEFFPGVFDEDVKEVALDGPTTPGGKKYDHILYKGLKLTTTKIDSQALTDHYPVIAEFETE